MIIHSFVLLILLFYMGQFNVVPRRFRHIRKSIIYNTSALFNNAVHI